MQAKNVISHLLNCDQTAYVKGRNVGESIRPIEDLMNYAEQENLDDLILQLILKKHLTQWIISSSLQVSRNMD